LNDLRQFKLDRWRQDDRGDFLSWLYPRLSKAIDTYRDTGASFETYMGAMIRWASKEYRSRRADIKAAEHAAWMIQMPDQYACQPEPRYHENGGQETEQGPSQSRSKTGSDIKAGSRQLLILILKCYCYVSDDFLDRIAPLAGIEKELLKEMVDKLRVLRLKRDEQLRYMRERVYCQFYRCIVYERRIAAMPENSVILARMQMRLLKARQRLAAMRKRLAGIRPEATNRQIAEIIGVSKGTVDSSLYVLKSRWNNNPELSILN
jgi:hypothetical protein